MNSNDPAQASLPSNCYAKKTDKIQRRRRRTSEKKKRKKKIQNSSRSEWLNFAVVSFAFQVERLIFCAKRTQRKEAKKNTHIGWRELYLHQSRRYSFIRHHQHRGGFWHAHTHSLKYHIWCNLVEYFANEMYTREGDRWRGGGGHSLLVNKTFNWLQWLPMHVYHSELIHF